MPLALLIVGAAIFISVLRNTHKQLGTQLAQDFTGSGSFVVWIAAVAAVGMIGYIPGWEKPSRALLALIMLSMFLANNGFFNKFLSAIQSPPKAATPDKEPTIPGPAPIKIEGLGGGGAGGLLGGGSGGILGTAISAGTSLATGGLT